MSTAIKSILTQTLTDFELLIFNDGSTDRSKEIIRQFNDPRIKFFDYEINTGLVTRLNAGIDSATGKYIARMDADDISLPPRFEMQIDFLENNTEIGLFQDHEEICIKLLRQNSFAHPVVMIRRSVLLDHGIRYEPDYFPSEDYRLWIRLKHVTRFHNIPETLLHYRVHSNQTSTIELHNKKSNGIKIELIRELLGDLSEKEEALYIDIIKQDYKSNSSYLSDLSGDPQVKNALEKTEKSFFSG